MKATTAPPAGIGPATFGLGNRTDDSQGIETIDLEQVAEAVRYLVISKAEKGIGPKVGAVIRELSLVAFRAQSRAWFLSKGGDA